MAQCSGAFGQCFRRNRMRLVTTGGPLHWQRYLFVEMLMRLAIMQSELNLKHSQTFLK